MKLGADSISDIVFISAACMWIAWIIYKSMRSKDDNYFDDRDIYN